MTYEELDEILDGDWNEAVDAFDPPGDDTNEDAFQDALRDMVRGLQRKAFDRGYEEVTNGEIRLNVPLDVRQSKEIVKAMLNDHPIMLTLRPFE